MLYLALTSESSGAEYMRNTIFGILALAFLWGLIFGDGGKERPAARHERKVQRDLDRAFDSDPKLRIALDQAVAAALERKKPHSSEEEQGSDTVSRDES